MPDIITKLSKLLVIAILITISCNGSNEGKDIQVTDRSYVLLVSFDGFGHDYVSKYNTPNFDRFIAEGASTERMIPSFPSKTFPNHYTLVTGLYPGNHGLVDNTFYDKNRKETYRISDRAKVSDAYYYGGIPLWQLAQMNGMKSASYFWVGSEAPVTGTYPDYYYVYDESVSNESRIKQVMDWFGMPESDRPVLVTLYFSFVDSTGHEYGPDSEQTRNAVEEADRLLGLLMEGVESISLNINVILVSDHGMYPMVSEPETYIDFDEFFDVESASFLSINNGTHAHIYSLDNNPDTIDSTYNALLSQKDSRYDVYKKENMPQKWHYDNDRVGDILIVANPGKYFVRRGASMSEEIHWGTHGYDPYTCKEVGAIFYARGPDIIGGSSVEPFENVHIYPFVAKLLGIEIPEIDGNTQVLDEIIIKN